MLSSDVLRSDEIRSRTACSKHDGSDDDDDDEEDDSDDDEGGGAVARGVGDIGVGWSASSSRTIVAIIAACVVSRGRWQGEAGLRRRVEEKKVRKIVEKNTV